MVHLRRTMGASWLLGQAWSSTEKHVLFPELQSHRGKTWHPCSVADSPCSIELECGKKWCARGQAVGWLLPDAIWLSLPRLTLGPA